MVGVLGSGWCLWRVASCFTSSQTHFGGWRHFFVYICVCGDSWFADVERADFLPDWWFSSLCSFPSQFVFTLPPTPRSCACRLKVCQWLFCCLGRVESLVVVCNFSFLLFVVVVWVFDWTVSENLCLTVLASAVIPVTFVLVYEAVDSICRYTTNKKHRN